MSFFDSIFGKRADPSANANKYLNQIPGQLEQGYGRAIEQGQNPAQTLNDFMKQYQQSEGGRYAQDEALRASGNAAAAGGMAGTPSDQFGQGRLAAAIGNDQMQQWLQNVLGINNQGLQAEQGKAGDMTNLYTTQGTMGFQQGQQQNQQRNQLIQSLMQMLGQGAGAAMGKWM